MKSSYFNLVSVLILFKLFVSWAFVFVFLVTVYSKDKVLKLPVKIRFGESQIASVSSPVLQSSATTSQTESGL